MVSRTWTAVAGSLTARDRSPQADVGQEPKCEQRILVEGAFLPGYQPMQDGRVGHVATAQIGDWGTLLKGVAYADLEHDDGTVGRVEQAGQVNLLQDGLRVRPYDSAAQWRQHTGGTRPSGPGSAVQVIQDGAALCGDRR